MITAEVRACLVIIPIIAALDSFRICLPVSATCGLASALACWNTWRGFLTRVIAWGAP